MSEKFDLERRAEELYPKHRCDEDVKRRMDKALQLARELAEAIAAEIEERNGRCFESAIARSFARPRSREDVYREALETMRNCCACVEIGCSIPVDHKKWCPAPIAQRALDEADRLKL